MKDKIRVTCSPHVRDTSTTQKVMRDVCIALLPALIASVIFFGFRALALTAVCVVSCILFEFLYNLVYKREQTIHDFSAVVTGMLLAFNLPVTLPFYMAVIGCFIAIVITKMLFGGLGKNFANPAIVGRMALFIAFAEDMSNWVMPGGWRTGKIKVGATPLASGKASYLDLFLGNIGGTIGEISALALLIGFVYLILRKIIKPTTTLAFIGTVFIFTFVLGQDPLYQILSGGLMLGAIFMATDYSSTPFTNWGRVVFGVGCGLLTVMIRTFGVYPEGVSFAILLMNFFTPWIDIWTRPEQFGSNTPYRKRRIWMYSAFGAVAIMMISIGVVQLPKAKIVDTNGYLTNGQLTSAIGKKYTFEEVDPSNKAILNIYKSGNKTAYVSQYKGFEDNIVVLVTIDDQGKILSVQSLHNVESASAAKGIHENSDYLNQFSNVDSIENIDTVTGATITSKAYKNAIQLALNYHSGDKSGIITAKEDNEPENIQYVTEEQLKAELGENYELVSNDLEDENVVEVYKSDNLFGIVSKAKGYENDIAVLVVIDENRTIKNVVSVLNSESIGGGKKIHSEPDYLNKFIGLQDVSEVETVSGATVSSTAYKTAIQSALAFDLDKSKYVTEEQLKAELGENYELVSNDIEDENVVEVYKSDNLFGIVSKAKGYENDIAVLVVIDENRTIKNVVSVLNSESIGGGKKIHSEPDYLNKFIGLQNASEVETVSGATVSSTAYKTAIQSALNYNLD